MKRKIFVVDDEKQIVSLLSVVLREADFDVETFYDARSALLRANDCLPDILVTDITMPETDGITLAKAFQERKPGCKIILISGNPHWKTRDGSQVEGLNDFALLLKPFSISQLLRLIDSEQI